VKADLGQIVRRGDLLAVVDSAEIGTAKARYLTTQSAATLAQKTYERTQSLTKSGSVASRMELESLTERSALATTFLATTISDGTPKAVTTFRYSILHSDGARKASRNRTGV